MYIIRTGPVRPQKFAQLARETAMGTVDSEHHRRAAAVHDSSFSSHKSKDSRERRLVGRQVNRINVRFFVTSSAMQRSVE